MTTALRATFTRYGSVVWVLVCAAAVAVFLLYARIPTTSTDRGGVPDAAQIENGPVVVDARHPILAPGVRAVTKTDSGTFALTGIAANARTGRTVPGARVTLANRKVVYRTRTNRLGAWTFANVPARDPAWTIRVDAPGYGVFAQTGTFFLPDTAYEMTSALTPKTRK
jgi:hypothetical protein